MVQLIRPILPCFGLVVALLVPLLWRSQRCKCIITLNYDAKTFDKHAYVILYLFHYEDTDFGANPASFGQRPYYTYQVATQPLELCEGYCACRI